MEKLRAGLSAHCPSLGWGTRLFLQVWQLGPSNAKRRYINKEKHAEKPESSFGISIIFRKSFFFYYFLYQFLSSFIWFSWNKLFGGFAIQSFYYSLFFLSFTVKLVSPFTETHFKLPGYFLLLKGVLCVLCRALKAGNNWVPISQLNLARYGLLPKL